MPQTSDKVEKYFFVEKIYAKYVLRAKFNIYVPRKGPVTKIENIKTDATKILRPTHFGE